MVAALDLWKKYCLDSTQVLSEKNGYSFSVVFSASENTRKEIHSKFLEFLKSCELLVGEAKSKNVYQMSFDLFPWC